MRVKVWLTDGRSARVHLPDSALSAEEIVLQFIGRADAELIELASGEHVRFGEVVAVRAPAKKTLSLASVIAAVSRKFRLARPMTEPS
jgi:hypothetical protein